MIVFGEDTRPRDWGVICFGHFNNPPNLMLRVGLKWKSFFVGLRKKDWNGKPDRRRGGHAPYCILFMLD